MRERHQRRARKPPDLTSLFDVMFIVVFVALIRAASAQQAAAQAAAPPTPPAPVVAPLPVDVQALRARALTSLEAELASRTPLVIRVAADGKIVSLQAGGTTRSLDVPLLEQDPDPDVGLKYLGDRSTELRLCRIAAVHLALPDLAGHLVIVAVEAPLADLPHALFDGLHRDLDHCLADQRGLATLVDPLTSTPTR